MGVLKFECEVPRPVGCIFPQRVCVLEIAIFHNCFSTVFVQRCVFVGSTGVSTFVPLHSTPHRTFGILLLVRLAKLTSMTCSIIGFDTNRGRGCVGLSSRVRKPIYPRVLYSLCKGAFPEGFTGSALSTV